MRSWVANIDLVLTTGLSQQLRYSCTTTGDILTASLSPELITRTLFNHLITLADTTRISYFIFNQQHSVYCPTCRYH